MYDRSNQPRFKGQIFMSRGWTNMNLLHYLSYTGVLAGSTISSIKKVIQLNVLNTSRKSLQFLRGEHYDINEELNEMIERRREKEAKATTSVNSWTWMFRRLASPAYFRPFVCLGFIKIIMQWGGNNIIMIYMVAISLIIFYDNQKKTNCNA